MKRTHRRAAGMLAVGTAAALALSACGPEPEPIITFVDGPLVISVAYWGNAGLTEDATGPSLESVYESTHPWIDIQLIPSDFVGLHEGLTQALLAGSGAPNIVLVHEDYITEFVAQSDDFVNLLDLGALGYRDDHLFWNWQQAENPDGSVLIGVGADVGGMALCYRKDLFDAAGIPSDRDEVSAMLGDSWEDLIAVGEQYVASTGKMFIDNATNVMNPAIVQLGSGYSYYNRNDELYMDNIKPAFDMATDVIDSGISAGIASWSDEWNAGLTSDDFAVLLCPQWMLDSIEDQVSTDPSFTGQWDIADIPGPGGNWGGSFYTLPSLFSTPYEQQEAWNLIEWLIQPEQQLKIMAKTGRLPAQSSILESDAVAGLTNEFFNDAPYGEIFAKTVLDIPGPIYHSRCEGAVRTSVENVLDDLQSGMWEMKDPWDAAVEAAEAADQCSND